MQGSSTCRVAVHAGQKCMQHGGTGRLVVNSDQQCMHAMQHYCPAFRAAVQRCMHEYTACQVEVNIKAPIMHSKIK